MSSEPNPRPDETPAPRLGHQPALDGIRGLAVLVVLCHNLHWPGFKGGFFGVDMFFALSGFLITTLLLEDHARSGRISLRRFFLRRFFRLYPALVVLMAFSAISVWFDPRAVSAGRVATVTASVLAYWSNYLVIANPAGWLGGLNHTWSLAVEVHFYLIWAILMGWITARWGRDCRILGLIAAGFAAGSVLWRLFQWSRGAGETWLYAGTDMRLDAIFLGALAGLLRWAHLARSEGPVAPDMDPRLIRTAEGVAIGVLVFLITTVPQKSPLPSLGAFAAAGAATSLLILTVLLHRGSLLAAVVSWPVLAWFGQISYSLYLWHVPVGKLFSLERLAAHGVPLVAAQLVRVGVSVAIAAGSYYCIERYFLRLKDRWARAK
ncbi:MAG TPA: acyltransferase [Lacunisphaera sp.]|nr:acyltransferase [Lacunisphaera sp.]